MWIDSDSEFEAAATGKLERTRNARPLPATLANVPPESNHRQAQSALDRVFPLLCVSWVIDSALRDLR